MSLEKLANASFWCCGWLEEVLILHVRTNIWVLAGRITGVFRCPVWLDPR